MIRAPLPWKRIGSHVSTRTAARDAAVHTDLTARAAAVSGRPFNGSSSTAASNFDRSTIESTNSPRVPDGRSPAFLLAASTRPALSHQRASTSASSSLGLSSREQRRLRTWRNTSREGSRNGGWRRHRVEDTASREPAGAPQISSFPERGLPNPARRDASCDFPEPGPDASTTTSPEDTERSSGLSLRVSA